MVYSQLHCRELALRHNRSLALVTEAERRSESALQGMLLARQEREVVGKFFERQRAAYDRELTRTEQKFLDELAHRRLESVHGPSPELQPAS
jgi:flagellar export protein FliJ